MISLLFLLGVESYLLSSTSSFSLSLLSSMKRGQRHYDERRNRLLYAEDSTRGGGAGVVEQRKVETVDNIENRTQGKNRRLSLGSGSDDRVIDSETNIHQDLLNIIRSLQQKELLMSLKHHDLSENEKLNRISLASKDDLLPYMLNDDNKAINSFQLGAAGLFDEWNE